MNSIETHIERNLATMDQNFPHPLSSLNRNVANSNRKFSSLRRTIYTISLACIDQHFTCYRSSHLYITSIRLLTADTSGESTFTSQEGPAISHRSTRSIMSSVNSLTSCHYTNRSHVGSNARNSVTRQFAKLPFRLSHSAYNFGTINMLFFFGYRLRIFS